MLIASTLSEVSDNSFGVVGYKANPPIHVKFVVEDSIAFLQQLNVRVTSDDNSDGGKEAISKNFGTSVIAKSKIEAWNKDSSAIVVDFTNLFLSDFRAFSFFSRAGFLTGEFKRDNSALGAIKTFDDNFSITSTLSYEMSIKVLFFTLLDKYPVSAKVTRSFLLLPEDKMTPRIADARVGIFPTEKLQFSQQKDGSFKYALANRWRLEPSNPEAYARGEKVTPVKPILFYVDNAFPGKWKEPIRKSVLHWNTAFEAIGFKDAVQVKDFPVNDPSFDPDNLKYSCIRYLPSSTENAMGPSWVDPTTGEIISATVLVYNDVVRLLNKWRYVQTAQLDESIRNGKLTDELFNESIEYVVGHEVGHCLGFMHNMASSNAFPVDSLRSATFTQQYGTTPSIMDYARFNYVAQPQDKQVKLTPPQLGEYDYFLVKWNYQPVPGTKTEWDEQATLESWVDAKAGNPIYRYGKQQILSRYDPSSIEEDLGNDPVKASEYGIQNLKYILSNLNNWVKDDPDHSYRQGIYDEIMNQYYRYIRNVMYNVGGIYLNEVKDGTAGKLHQSVPKELQKNALKWTLNQYRQANWLNNAELRKKLSPGLDPAVLLRGKLLGELKKLTKNVLLSSHISDNPYGIGEYLNDLYTGAFEGTIAGRKLNASDISLQNFVADMALEPFEEKKSTGLFGLNDQAFAPSSMKLLLMILTLQDL
ncbi:zinc-dependent metalloprotease [Paraflavitalea speifideaquila]|uniref:zinc-dependent metalloprotease n=1 Tax=Paraflavitalea speifideaquila TaxID=3076558 RepID=UPI00331304CF